MTGAARCVLFVAVCALAACGGGETPDGTASSSSSSSSSTSGTTSLNLTLSGTPATSVVAGTSYSFLPTVKGNSGTVVFSVAGAPAWAAFNTANGALSGTPTSADVGAAGPITITASDEGSSASIGPFTINVTAATTAPQLTLSGTPGTSVTAGSTYLFQPTVTESSGTVSFSITGLPAWATFNAATGSLSGNPSTANEGTTGPITITASDGGATASIGPFTIDVTAPGAPGSATLVWSAPTQNTDGSAISGLTGYIIQYGPSTAQMTQSISVPSASTTSYEIGNLAPGTYYFEIIALSSDGTQSAPSNVGSVTI